MAQTKAQKKRAIEAKKRNTVKSGKYKGWHVEITKTSYGKKCNMCGKNSKDKHSDYCKSCNAKFKRDDEKSYDTMMRKKGAMGY